MNLGHFNFNPASLTPKFTGSWKKKIVHENQFCLSVLWKSTSDELGDAFILLIVIFVFMQ